MMTAYLFSLGVVAIACVTFLQALLLRLNPCRSLLPVGALLLALLVTASTPFLIFDLARVIAATWVVRACVDQCDDGGRYA